MDACVHVKVFFTEPIFTTLESFERGSRTPVVTGVMIKTGAALFLTLHDFSMMGFTSFLDAKQGHKHLCSRFIDVCWEIRRSSINIICSVLCRWGVSGQHKTTNYSLPHYSVTVVKATTVRR